MTHQRQMLIGFLMAAGFSNLIVLWIAWSMRPEIKWFDTYAYPMERPYTDGEGQISDVFYLDGNRWLVNGRAEANPRNLIRDDGLPDAQCIDWCQSRWTAAFMVTATTSIEQVFEAAARIHQVCDDVQVTAQWIGSPDMDPRVRNHAAVVAPASDRNVPTCDSVGPFKRGPESIERNLVP